MNSPPNPLSTEVKRGLNLLIIKKIPLFAYSREGDRGSEYL